MGSKIVYRGVVTNWAEFELLDIGLIPLLKDIASKEGGESGGRLTSCPAVKQKHKNTFVQYLPYDIKFKYENEQYVSNREGILSKISPYENGHSLDWQFETLFFSEDEQIISTSPPFLHKTNYSQYGHVPSGSFDISKWFRPLIGNFNLWPGITEFIATKGEAFMYYDFPNKDKVVIKDFYVTDKLREIAFHSVNYKNNISNQNLNSLYNVFSKSNLKKVITKEIKNNII